MYKGKLTNQKAVLLTDTPSVQVLKLLYIYIHKVVISILKSSK